jgi:transcription elongation factor
VWILGKREPSWKPGGPAHQKGERGGSWLQTAEEKGRSNMATGAGDGLATALRDVYAQSECYCALYSNCIV